MLARHHRFVLLTVCCLPLAGGCTRWRLADEDAANWTLPAPRMSLDTVILEVAFVRVSAEQAGEHLTGALWHEIDEQAIDTDLRRELNANGLRCGIVGTNLPASVQRLLEQQHDQTSNPLPSEQPPEAARQHRLQSREGERTTIAAGPIRDSLHLFVNDEGSVRGETFEQAQCMIALRSFALGDGRVRLELTPEIEYGEPRNRRVGKEGVWRLDFGRDSKSFDDLRASIVLDPGRTFLITSTPQPAFLGAAFFGRGEQEQQLLLIRVAQTQKDDLFAAGPAG